MRILVAVACLLPFALAAEAAINRHSPEATVKAAYTADEPSIDGSRRGIMDDNALRTRFFSRSLLRSIAANETIADGRGPASRIVGDPFRDAAPHMVALRIDPISEAGDSATVLAEFARGDGARERLTYAMVSERGEWRIDDIAYAMLDGETRTLRGELAAN